MRTIKYQQAVREGYAAGMRADDTTYLVGEGIGWRGGCFLETKGAYEEFGAERVIDTPISEAGFVGMCCGSALCGTRTIANMMFVDFTTLAMDQIVNQAAKMSYLSAGQYKMPMTLTGMYGVAPYGGAHHTQSLHPWFIYIPGIKVVMPATPYDVKGLLASAILDDNLTIVLHHRYMINIKGEVPEEDYFLPLAEAEVVVEGSDITVVAPGMMRHHAVKAAEALSKKGVSVEVIDPRTLYPLDEEAILNSVKKTGHLLVVDEGYSPCGFGAEVIATVQEKAFDYLDAPMRRLHTADVPTPYTESLVNAIVPGVDKIEATITEILS